DAGPSPVKVTLTASNGTITLNVTAGLTFTSGDGTADATMTFTGTSATIDARMNGMSFTPTANFNGAANLQIITDDQGNTGTGGALSDTDNVAITVNAVNDAPVNSVPGAQSTNEDTAMVFSTGNGNLISISDVDASGSSLQVTLTGTNGMITLAGTSGLTFSAGDGTADATMTFTGKVTKINTALNGLSFAPTANFNGAANLQIVTNDQGNTGAGGALSDTDSVAITVNAVNDAPVNSVPAAQSTNEDTALVFSSGNGNLISISDVDAGASSERVTLTGTNGAITLSGTSGLTFSTGDGTADATMTFTGTMANINTALNGMSFAPNANFFGGASLAITTNDQGNTGSGGALIDSDSVAITVTEVNDAPIASAVAVATNEDTVATGNVLASVTDPDNTDGIVGNEDTLTAVLDAGPTNGSLTLNANGSFTYTPNANYFGSDSFTYHAIDSRGAASNVATVSLTITEVNDAPVAADDVATTNEDNAVSGNVLTNDSDTDNRSEERRVGQRRSSRQ